MGQYTQVDIIFPPHYVRQRVESQDSREKLPGWKEMVKWKEQYIDKRRPTLQVLNARQQVAAKIEFLDHRARKSIESKKKHKGQRQRRLAVISRDKLSDLKPIWQPVKKAVQNNLIQPNQRHEYQYGPEQQCRSKDKIVFSR